MEEDKDGKVLCNEIMRFEGSSRKLYIRFDSVEEYVRNSSKVEMLVRSSKGTDEVIIVAVNKETGKMLTKKLDNVFTNADSKLLNRLYIDFGENNVKLVD